MSLSSFLVPGGASGMTSFFSIEYMFVFLPIAILLYWLSPQKIRRYVLLFESCAFFWLISGKLIAYLVLSAVLIYGFGLWIEKVNEKKKEAIHDLDRDEKKKIKKHFAARLRLVFGLCRRQYQFASCADECRRAGGHSEIYYADRYFILHLTGGFVPR